MGADLILAVCEVPGPDELTPEYATQIARSVDDLDEAALAEIVEWCGFEDSEVDTAIDQARTKLQTAAFEQLSTLATGDWFRDVVYLQLGDKWYLMSGGTSWGDPPTESYEQVLILDISGLTRKESE